MRTDTHITSGPELSLPADLPQYRRRQLTDGIRFLLSRSLAGDDQVDGDTDDTATNTNTETRKDQP